MWCDRVLGNVATYPARQWDLVDVDWSECGRTLNRASRGGRAVRVLLPPGQRFGQGDVVFDDGTIAIAIEVRACEVIVARPPTARLLALLALELGNLHWPTEVNEAGEVIFVEDGPAMEALDRLPLTGTREVRRFRPEANVVGSTLTIASDFVRVTRA